MRLSSRRRLAALKSASVGASTFAPGYRRLNDSTICSTVAFCATIIGFLASPSRRHSIAVVRIVYVLPVPTA